MKFYYIFFGLALAVILFNFSYLTGNTTAALAPQNINGTVLETMNGGGYTYVKVDDGKQKIWVAIPQSKIEKGDDISLAEGSAMMNFKAKSLNRTFDTIIFSPGLVGAGKGSGSGNVVVPTATVTVAKAEGKNSYTVGEIYEKRKELDGTIVRISGKVVKFTPMIMGRNWIHLQDGTGESDNNSHDLVVTSMDSPAKDSIVVIQGTVRVDKDFSAGYFYKVIVEDATVAK